jgi:hypothetical protein
LRVYDEGYGVEARRFEEHHIGFDGWGLRGYGLGVGFRVQSLGLRV